MEGGVGGSIGVVIIKNGESNLGKDKKNHRIGIIGVS